MIHTFIFYTKYWYKFEKCQLLHKYSGYIAQYVLLLCHDLAVSVFHFILLSVWSLVNIWWGSMIGFHVRVCVICLSHNCRYQWTEKNRKICTGHAQNFKVVVRSMSLESENIGAYFFYWHGVATGCTDHLNQGFPNYGPHIRKYINK